LSTASQRTVKDYLDQFRDLIYDSGYTDPKTIVVKFWGLDRWIATALAGIASGPPSDTDPEAWFKLAVLMDQNRAADEAFQASYRQTFPAGSASSTVPTCSSAFPWSLPPPQFSHIHPALGNPVLMDIDAVRKPKSTLDTCRRYGKLGHWAKDCNLCFDVQYMDTNRLERMLENKLAAKDAVLVEQPVQAEQPDSVEDFVSRNE
jgi:hypothetical protein